MIIVCAMFIFEVETDFSNGVPVPVLGPELMANYWDYIEVERLLSRRASTQPLNVPSCGSVFKNPPGDFAGRLIEASGLKGHRVGGAQISPIHANFIANTGGATAADVLALIREAQSRVARSSGARLHREVRIVGGAEE